MAEPVPGSESDHTHHMRNRRITRLVIGALALIYGIIFVTLNRAKVRIHFLFFTVTTRLWVGFLVSLAIGALLTQALLAYRRRVVRSQHSGEGGAAS